MSEQQPEPVSGDSGSVGPGASAPDLSLQSVPVTAAAEVEAPRLAPDEEETAPKADAPKLEAAKVEAPRMDAPKVEAPKAEAAKPEALRFPGKMMIMSPGERAWNGDEAGSKAEAEPAKAASGTRRVAAMAAVVALATVAGALGGALATAGIGHFMGGDQAVARDVVKDVVKDSALEATVARIDADITALKASVEHTTKMGTSQFNKTSDRLDKVEKAQAEPAAKLAELSKAVDKLRADAAGGSGRRRGQGHHGNGDPARDRSRSAGGSAQAGNPPAADRGRLGAARRRQWRRADRGAARHV